MPKSKYGTEHERYLGSGIIYLSQIQEIDSYHLHLCKKEQKEIESQFQRGACMPWLPESRLKVEIEKAKWETGKLLEVERLGDIDFPKLWFSDADIRIVGGIARFQAARVSSAAKLKEVFRLLETEERWWVVDFFEHGMTTNATTKRTRRDSAVSEREALDWKQDAVSSKRGALDWKQEAVRSFFYPPKREWCATRPSGKSLLPRTAHLDARLVSTIPGVKDAFSELTRLPSLWNAENFTYLSDVRKSFCHEEIENYILAIGNQWKDITLQWKSEILGCVDFESVKALQSRAPAISEDDFKFIREKFEKGKILPLLKDRDLRRQIESVILRQGPILTLDTFAKDVRLLQTRVREPLTGLLPRIYRKREDTLRRKICNIIEKEFNAVSVARDPCKATCEEREAFVRRCYYHVFLHTIRTNHIENPITRDYIRSLVIDELNHLCIDNRGGLQNLMSRERVISTQAPVDDLLEFDVGEKDRHGCDLLNKPTATKHLYYDQISNDYVSTSNLTRSYMAMHIVRIFLFGREAIEREKAPISGSPTVIAESAFPVSRSTSFNTSPISMGSSEEVGHTQNFSTDIVTPTILNERRVREVQIQAPITPVESMVASLITGEPSPGSPAHTSTTKRSSLISEFDIFGQKLTNDSRPVKRLRHEQDNRGGPHYERQSPTAPDLTVSPSSEYTVADGTSSIRHTSSVRSPSDCDLEKYPLFEIAEGYSKLIAGPYSELIEDGEISNRGKPQCNVDVTSSHTEATGGAPHQTNDFLRSISANAASGRLQTVMSPTPLPKYIMFRSRTNKMNFRCVPWDEQKTRRFAANQESLDRLSRFIYHRSKDIGLTNENIGLANDATQLWTAITRYGLAEVEVDSLSLASLEDPYSLGKL